LRASQEVGLNRDLLVENNVRKGASGPEGDFLIQNKSGRGASGLKSISPKKN
jgi:hypothetical protein